MVGACRGPNQIPGRPSLHLVTSLQRADRISRFFRICLHRRTAARASSPNIGKYFIYVLNNLQACLGPRSGPPRPSGTAESGGKHKSPPTGANTPIQGPNNFFKIRATLWQPWGSCPGPSPGPLLAESSCVGTLTHQRTQVPSGRSPGAGNNACSGWG